MISLKDKSHDVYGYIHLRVNNIVLVENDRFLKFLLVIFLNNGLQGVTTLVINFYSC